MNKKSFGKIVKIFFLFCMVAAAPEVLFAQEGEKTIITITHARETSYIKDKETSDELISLKGDVELSVKKGSNTTVIKAQSVTYDRETEILYAEDGVEIETKGTSGNERTTAKSILLNTSTLEGIFDGGKVIQTQSDAINLPSGSTLIVFSDVFGKSASNAITFKNSRLTFCDDENPHWHIDATRTWLLPGGEFAFFNALLYVGEIPVLYLPAFYYPKDELIFNPVFGFSKREGYYIENTVYVYGRKPLNTSTSSTTSSSSSSSTTTSNSSTSAEALKGLYNFMKPTVLKDQRLEGLILHNLDTDYKGNTTNYMKIMADYYSNLGWMTGFSGHFVPSSSFMPSLDASLMLGFSNTIFVQNGNYFNYSPASGRTYRDYSNFIGLKLPFRYGGKIAFTLTKPINFTLTMPFFSDPYFQYDYITNRLENMDWISYLLDNNKNETITVSEYSSFAWTITSNASLNSYLPDFLKTYFSTLSYNLSSSVQFTSVAASSSYLSYEGDMASADLSSWQSNTPERKFYFPSQVTPLSLSFNFGGTIVKYPSASSASSSSSKAPSFPVALNMPDFLKTPDQLENEQKEKEAQEKKAEGESDGEKSGAGNSEATEAAEAEEDSVFKTDFVKPVLPVLDFSPEKASEADGFAYSLNYTFNPSIITQLIYSSDTSNYMHTGSDFKWDNLKSSMYTIKLPLSLTNNFSYGGSFLSLTNSLNYSPIYQKHFYINTSGASGGGYTESEAKSLNVTDYKAESQDISTSNAISFMPFSYIPFLSETGVKWNSTIKLYRQEFIGDADNPDWRYYAPDWSDENCVTVNSLSVILGFAEMDKKFKQTLTFTNVMPPLLRQYTGTLNLVFPYVTETITTGLQEKTHQDVSYDEKWTRKPLQQSTTVSGTVLGSTLSFTESYNYNLQNYYSDSFKLSLSWYGFTTAYVMSYTTGYDFDDKNKKWVARSEKEFLPYTFSLSYSSPSKTFYRWFNRISVAPGLSTSISADLIRPTNSYFTFTPSLTFSLNNFFYIKFSSTSQNSVLYRYFQKMAGHEGRIPGEENIWVDLFNSFRFDDENVRKSSGFKLKSLNVEITHQLHDWKFNMTYSFSPRLISSSSKTYYDFQPYVTIGVVWNPMESMKTQIKDNYGEWSFQ